MNSWFELVSPAFVTAVVVLLWRHTNGRLEALSSTVARLASTVADIDRRLTRLEGRIDGWQDRRHPGAGAAE